MSERNNHREQPPINRMPMRPMGRGPGHMGGEKAKDLKGSLLRIAKYFKAIKFTVLLVLLVTAIYTFFGTVNPKVLGGAVTNIQNTVLLRNAYKEIEEKGYLPYLTAETDKGNIEILSELDSDYVSSCPENTIKALESYDFSQGLPKMDFTKIGATLTICLALYVLSALFHFLQSYLMAGVTQKTIYIMRADVNEKLNRLPISYFDKYTHGEILSRVVNDIDNISNTLQQSLSQIISSFITVVVVLIMMLTISPILTVITLFTIPFILVISMFVSKFSRKEFKANQKELGIINGQIEEMYTGHKVVVAFSKEDDIIKQFEETNKRLYRAGWRSQFISGLIMPLTNFINNVGYLLICVVGGYLAITGKIGVGDITAFTTYSRNFTQPIVQVAGIINSLQSAAASAERIFEILDEKEDIPDGDNAISMTSPRGAITFESVRFGYMPDRVLIKNLNLNVKAGQTVAIVGPTGAGKTTLVNLLMRFYEINGGKITIDGVDITQIKRNDLRNMFGMVLQDTWLFKGTIRDNIAYGKENPTEEEILRASKAAYVDHFIRTLSNGYDTVINEEASNISQGQKQLLTIARAILADPDILILDEATSSVDTRTEVLIQKAMQELMVGRTSFVIAHRLSTIRNADTILVINHGDIVEQGSHKELMEKKGFYAELYNSQFVGKQI